ncbi:MAG: hypothetical protein HN704_12030 [Bacteroidetes bacterium]|nr:hypothetical protein [Bacteroidota bacterium]MBT6687248.1 hypothetical protein [Bacteroidota bacterium]MBT7144717.1 hypothetical protein [Bacteroidota bacterium]MBT7492320.1 hypothetical protein [Bacteroidota bacterium]
MKSIVYILITVFISSILISAFPKSVRKEKQIVTIQCVNENYSPDILIKSADIIKARLKDYGIQNADVFVDHKASCIDISIDSQVELVDVTNLLTSKGSVEFYETYDRLEVIKNLGVEKDLASILNIPSDEKKIDGCTGIYGYCKEDKKSEVELYLKKHYASKPGHGINFYWSEQPNDNKDFQLFLLQSNASLDNSYISKSVVKNDLSGKKPELMVSFNESGKSIWKDITKRNIGKSIAIVMDKKVLQAPIVKSEIIEGKCIITGDFSINEINRINSLINNEELPLEFKLKN